MKILVISIKLLLIISLFVSCSSSSEDRSTPDNESEKIVLDSEDSDLIDTSTNLSNCEFNNQILNSNDSVIAYQQDLVPFGSVCQSETRICLNGVLTGTYLYEKCSVKSWTMQVGTEEYDTISGLTLSTNDDIIITGITEGKMDTNSSANDPYGVYVRKYDSTQKIIWTRQIGSVSNVERIISDSSNNLYIGGRVNGDVDLEGDGSEGILDGYLVKYSSKGTRQWSIDFGTTGTEYVDDIDLDLNGNIYLAGLTPNSFDGNIHFGDSDAYLIKYSSNGEKQWVRQIGSEKYDVAQSLKADFSGNIIIAGVTAGSINSNTSSGSWDAFLGSYDSNGNLKWIKQFGTSERDEAQAVTVDKEGNIYVSGITAGDLDGNYNNGGECILVRDSTPCPDVFLTKFSAVGEKKWTRLFGTNRREEIKDIDIDLNENIYLLGHTHGDLDGNTNSGGLCKRFDSTVNCPDVFLTKFDSNGSKKWTRLIGTESYDYADAVVVNDSGDIFIAGRTQGGIDGNQNIGKVDGFIAKYNSEGIKF